MVVCTNLELQKQVPCPDSDLAFAETQVPLHNAFHAKDFKTLDSLYGQWCKGTDRFPDGTWKLAQFGKGMYDLFTAWNTWTKHLDDLKAWQQSRPDSGAALYAEAIYWRAYAWNARGEGYAKDVSKEGWELYRERLTKAKAILTKLQASDSGCAAPYALIIGVLIDLSASDRQLRPVFFEAVRRYPEYHPIYLAMARRYEPKWGGSRAAYETFADEAAKLTRSFEGMGMYARVYWFVDYHEGIPFDIHAGRPPVWKKLRAGYEDLVRLYPSSLHILGKFADVACRSNDSDLYRALRSKIVGYESAAKMLDPIDACDRRHKWSSTKQ